jgi:acyl carrier protein
MQTARDRVLAELVRQLQENVEGQENLQIADLPLDRTFKDLGASSLDMVEVVSTMMSRLGVAVDRTAFAKLKSLGELVDLFAAELQKST